VDLLLHACRDHLAVIEGVAPTLQPFAVPLEFGQLRI